MAQKTTSFYSTTNAKFVAVIYRIEAQDPGEDTKLISRLVVVALNKGRAKDLGSTNGKDADAEARKLADTVKPAK